MKIHLLFTVAVSTTLLWGCKKDGGGGGTTNPPAAMYLLNTRLGNTTAVVSSTNYNIATNAVLKLKFDKKVSRATVSSGIQLSEQGGGNTSFTAGYENGDSTVVLNPANLKYITAYNLATTTSLKSAAGGTLAVPSTIKFVTRIDSSRKFPILTDDALLTKIQEQTFKYFWDFAHPVSGLARERNSSGDVVTSGGSGFGIMAIPVGINRNFITR